jgi:uncharacterized protein
MSAYKLSYYTIFSEPLNSREDCILFCTRTSEAILISKRVKDALENGFLTKLPSETFEYLKKKKAIVPEEEIELFSIIAENKDEIINENNTLYEVIQPTAFCQLGCDYCGQTHTKDFIDDSLQKNLINRIREKATNQKYNQLIIGWFGGEPLVGLPQIRSLTKELKKLCSELNMSYRAKVVTNGLSLKENIFLELVQQLGVDKIEITLDGIGIYHDKRRNTKKGENTFDIIFSNILSICNRSDFYDLGCEISLRCNVDHRNWDGVSPLIQLLKEHELQKKIAYFYPIGVYSWGGNTAQDKSLSKEEFAEQEINWFIEMLEAGFTPGLLPGRVKEVCLAVSKNSEMYDAFGNIFNCTEVSYTSFYEDTSYVLGNLKFNPETYSTNRPLSDWNDVILEGKFPCHTCKMLPVCGGACPKSWHEDMRACPSAKFNIKDRLALSYIISEKEGRELLFMDTEATTEFIEEVI